MPGKSNIPDDFSDAFNRIIAAHFWSPPDKAFMKAKKLEYFDTLKKYPVDVLNEAISKAKEESDAMPGTATLTNLCKNILERRAGEKSAAQRQADLEAEGERCKVDFIEAWSRLSRFNKWEIERVQNDAESVLVKQGFPREFLFGRRGEPGVLLRQKMIEISKERGVI